MSNNRKAAFAGMFYPDTKNQLELVLDKYLQKADQDLGINIDNSKYQIRAIISPHAAYQYSGQVAAYGYSQIPDNIDKFIIIGPSHKKYTENLMISDYDFWQTPLGKIGQIGINRFDLDQKLFQVSNQYHTIEHSIEVQIPFIQKIREKNQVKNDENRILPIVTSNLSFKNILKAKKSLLEMIDEDTLLIISTDFSHYLPYKYAIKKDNETINKILNFETIDNYESACGVAMINILIEMAKEKQWKVKKLIYRNSGDISGDRESVVGYTSIIFFEQLG